MTNADKTVSTERLEELLRLEIGERDRYLEGTFLWLKHDDKANAFAELITKRTLASRTQSPAEWRGDRFTPVIAMNGHVQEAWMRLDPDGLWVRYSDALRAASITPPAPKRSKEDVITIDGMQATICEALLDAFPMADKVADNYAAVAAKAVAANAHTRRALETPPLHKERGALAALRDAIAWIVEAPHDEHCFTNDPNPDACRCVCGKDAILDRLYEAEPVSPLPVAITQYMVDRTTGHLFNSLGLSRWGFRLEDVEKVAREVLEAALSKPDGGRMDE